MSEHGEGHSAAYERISSKKSLKEILEVATEFERTARDFYTSLIPRVSKRIRYLVEELAEEEQEHFDMFTELASREDISEQISEEVAAPASDTRFSDCIHLPDLGDNPDDQAVLQYAMGREHAAMSQYAELARTSPEGPIRDLFVFLSSEEAKHKQELEKIYYETIHSGGV